MFFAYLLSMNHLFITVIVKIFHYLNRTKKLFLFVITLLMGYMSFAQQPAVYNQFFMNPYLYNPAYAGVEGHSALFFMHRNQWINIQGAPEINHLSFHVPLRGGIAIGGTAFNFSEGLLNVSGAKFTIGYLINIDRTHFIRFGISGGGGINAVNISKFDSPDDIAFDNFLEQNSFLIGDLGISYHFGHFNVGFSLPNLFNYVAVTQEGFVPVDLASPLDNIIGKMNYRGHITDNFAIEPHVIYRYSESTPSQYEAALIAHIRHLVWLGVSYREDSGIIGLGGVKIKEKIGIGISYELGNPNIFNQLGPSLEVNIGYHLGIKKEHAQHTASFIKSHRLSAEERAKAAELERLKSLADTTLAENIEQDSVNDASTLPEAKIPVENTEIAEPEIIAEPEELNEQPVVKKGNHLLELPIGNFVIGGAFSAFRYAENFSDEVFESGFHDTFVGYSTARGYYYVVIFQSNNEEQARAKLNEIKRFGKFKNAWLLQVNE